MNDNRKSEDDHRNDVAPPLDRHKDAAFKAVAGNEETEGVTNALEVPPAPPELGKKPANN